MIKLLKHITDVAKGKIPPGMHRSDKWPEVRAAHLKLSPTCVVCGSINKIEVHHIKPFHLQPELELDPTNLVSLCESLNNGVNCHLFFGHLGDFKSYNAGVLEDIKGWLKNIVTRP